MKKFRTLTDEEKEFCVRVRVARMASGIKPKDMGLLLGISESGYKHFEWRTLMRPTLIAKFCAAVQVPLDFLHHGTGKYFLPQQWEEARAYAANRWTKLEQALDKELSAVEFDLSDDDDKDLDPPRPRTVPLHAEKKPA